MVTDSTVRAHFDRVAPEYESNRLGDWYVAHGRFIADRLTGRRFAVALDVGCGTGWLLRRLSYVYDGYGHHGGYDRYGDHGPYRQNDHYRGYEYDDGYYRKKSKKRWVNPPRRSTFK